MFRAAREAFGPVDILVNNAGVYAFAPLTAVDAEDFQRQVGTNLPGTLLTMQAFAGQDDLGPASIVNVSTAGTLSHPPYAGLYVATKSGEFADAGPVVTFLASDAARWITGDVLLVSGGQR